MAPPATSDRTYGGASQAERSADRRARLVEAALTLVDRVGVVGLTVGAVCVEASLAKRYFYESFDSLDDLLSSALRSVFDQIARTIDEAPSDDVLTAAVEAVVDAMEDPRVARLYVESAGNLALLATRDEAVDAFVDQLLEQVVGDRVDEVGAQMVAHLLVSGSTHVVAMWLRGGLAMDRDEFVQRLVGLGTVAAEALR